LRANAPMAAWNSSSLSAHPQHAQRNDDPACRAEQQGVDDLAVKPVAQDETQDARRDQLRDNDEHVSTASADETWEQPWGEQRFVRNHYNQLTLRLAETSGLQRR